MKTPNTKTSSLGFTLVEVLVGLTLLGLIMTMLYSGLYTTSRSWAAGNSQANANDDYRLILSFIRRTLAQTAPILYLDGEDNPVIFNGVQASMEFVTRLPAHRGGGDLYFASLTVEDDDRGESALWFTYRPLQPGMDLDWNNETGESQRLMEDVHSIALAYFGRDEPDEEPAWHSEWRDRPRLPTIVRLRIESTDPDRIVPEMVMQLPTQVERGQPQMILRKEPRG